jgi:NitT/TauT family transport system permease protein
MNVISKEANEPITTPENSGAQVKRSNIGRRLVLVYGLRLLILAVFVGGWEFASSTGIIDPFFWGKPSGIWEQIVTWATQGTAQGSLWDQILITLEEAILGFMIGVVFGVIFGVVLGRNHFLADLLSPFIKAANAIPRVVLGPIFVIGLGLGMQSKVALAAVMVFFVVFFNAFQGVSEVDRNLLANARILGASQRQLSTEVIIPSALSWILTSLHTSFSFALVGAIVGEFVGAVQGLGLLIQTAKGTFNVNGVFAAMAIMTAVALIMDVLVTALENRLIRWRPNTVNEVTI